MPKRIAVVVSQGQSQNPVKRQLEEDIVTSLLLENGIDVTVIPHLYDLPPDGTGTLALQGIPGNLIVLSWLYERAARWTLDRNSVRGKIGVTLLKNEDDDDEDNEGSDEAESNGDDKQRFLDLRKIPDRTIWCLDLRASQSADDFVAEIKRIAGEANTDIVQLTDWVGGTPTADQMNRFVEPTNDTALGPPGQTADAPSGAAKSATTDAQRISEEPARRWYPVIDFSRCTNCMECIDFCLFGVYGVDVLDTILVEQPDNCRKGCPACSRVCPENAIIFPQHKSPAIAGSPAEVGSLKIDLSRLFGGSDPIEVAARERDEQLVLAGRDAVGLKVGIPKRQTDKPAAANDDLDDLIDELDELDL